MQSEKNDAKHITDLFLKQFTRFLPNYLFWKNSRSVYLGCNQRYAELMRRSGVKSRIVKNRIYGIFK